MIPLRAMMALEGDTERGGRVKRMRGESKRWCVRVFILHGPSGNCVKRKVPQRAPPPSPPHPIPSLPNAPTPHTYTQRQTHSPQSPLQKGLSFPVPATPQKERRGKRERLSRWAPLVHCERSLFFLLTCDPYCFGASRLGRADSWGSCGRADGQLGQFWGREGVRQESEGMR